MRNEDQSLLGVVKAWQIVKRMMMNRRMVGDLADLSSGFFIPQLV
jgi:hypothetical protein